MSTLEQLEQLQAVGRGLRITTKPKLTAACGATFEEQRVLDGHERLCLTCQQLRAGRPEMVSPLAMRDDFIDPNDLLQYDAGAVDGIVVSRRFRVVNKQFEFWLLDSASSANVSGVSRDYVVNREIAVPSELLARLYQYSAAYFSQVPSGATKAVREDLDAVLKLFGRERSWT